MYRFAIESLLQWKEKENRKPLLLMGARQVGKTWLMKEFGKKYYDKVRAAFESEASKKFFQTDYLIRLMDDHYNGLADNSRKIWAVYTFLVWYDVYFGEQQSA